MQYRFVCTLTVGRNIAAMLFSFCFSTLLCLFSIWLLHCAIMALQLVETGTIRCDMKVRKSDMIDLYAPTIKLAFQRYLLLMLADVIFLPIEHSHVFFKYKFNVLFCLKICYFESKWRPSRVAHIFKIPQRRRWRDDSQHPASANDEVKILWPGPCHATGSWWRNLAFWEHPLGSKHSSPDICHAPEQTASTSHICSPRPCAAKVPRRLTTQKPVNCWWRQGAWSRWGISREAHLRSKSVWQHEITFHIINSRWSTVL